MNGKWTQEIPKENGHYWLRDKFGHHLAEIRNGHLCVHAGNDCFAQPSLIAVLEFWSERVISPLGEPRQHTELVEIIMPRYNVDFNDIHGAYTN